jgi:Thioesterase-like superfamily
MEPSPLDFGAATAVRRLSGDTFRADIPDGWSARRGAFGGLVLAAMLRAMERVEPDRRRLTRTLTGDLCAPVQPGPADIAVRTSRRGGSQTNLLAELRQGGDIKATASAVLSLPRPHAPPRAIDVVPDGAGWDETPAVESTPTVGSAFANYEYRAVMSGAAATHPDGAALDGWIRERRPLDRLDAPALVARLDAWWPTWFRLESERRPVATISFLAEILVDPRTIPPHLPLRYRATTAASGDGFTVELRELRHDGRIAALNQQMFAILG